MEVREEEVVLEGEEGDAGRVRELVRCREPGQTTFSLVRGQERCKGAYRFLQLVTPSLTEATPERTSCKSALTVSSSFSETPDSSSPAWGAPACIVREKGGESGDVVGAKPSSAGALEVFLLGDGGGLRLVLPPHSRVQDGQLARSPAPRSQTRQGKTLSAL